MHSALHWKSWSCLIPPAFIFHESPIMSSGSRTARHSASESRLSSFKQSRSVGSSREFIVDHQPEQQGNVQNRRVHEPLRPHIGFVARGPEADLDQSRA